MIEINDMIFDPVEGIKYKYKYESLLKKHKKNEQGLFRELCLKDLWFLVYFVMRVPNANHPFVIEAAREVQDGPESNTLELWARGHFKSTIITIAETIQTILRDHVGWHDGLENARYRKDSKVLLLSYTRDLAGKFAKSIKTIFETSDLLKASFPDVLYADPKKESPLWTDDKGFWVKRKGTPKEATVAAYGLIDGMPTGGHYSRIVCDDIMTLDLSRNPDQMAKVKESFALSLNLKDDDCCFRVVGTPYHHEDVLMHIKSLINPITQEPVDLFRKNAATVDGTPNGESVFLASHVLDELRADRRAFFCQQLLDPTPKGEESLKAEYLNYIDSKDIPEYLYKFMTIDPAGHGTTKKDKDSWAITVCGIDPIRDAVGASDNYILDMVVKPMDLEEAMNTVCEMYQRNGMILKLGVEKTSLSTMEVHIVNALMAKGISISEKAGTLVLLRPGRGSKVDRIEKSLIWPLNNGKIKVNKAIPEIYRKNLVEEMEKFPHWHDDTLDAISYRYTLIKDYRFPPLAIEKKRKKSVWEIAESDYQRERSWLYV